MVLTVALGSWGCGDKPLLACSPSRTEELYLFALVLAAPHSGDVYSVAKRVVKMSDISTRSGEHIN